MKPSFLLIPALASTLLLPACGARSSLTEPGVSRECASWTVHDGDAKQIYSCNPLALLDDGSVVLPMADGVAGSDGDTPVTWNHSWLRKIEPDGAVAWEVGRDLDGVKLIAAARGADGIYAAGLADDGMLGGAGSCAGEGPCSFVARLTEAGQPAWVKTLPSNSAADRSYLRDLAITDDGGIILGGGFEGTLDLGCEPHSGTAGGAFSNLFVARLSPAGECLWSRAITLPDSGLERMAVDGAGDVALALSLDGPPGSTVDFGGGPLLFGNDSHNTSFAVAKYAPDGALVFARAATCKFTFGWASVAVTSAGEVLLSASCMGTIDLGGGPRGSPDVDRLFVTKFGATGEELWTRDIATAGGGQAPPVIATEPGAGFFLAGEIRPDMALLTEPVQEHALFTAAFDAGGNPTDVQTFPAAPNTGLVSVVRLSAHAGSLALDGTFNGTLDLGQSPLDSEGPQDVFVTKICR